MLFKRRKTTAWSQKEAKALTDIMKRPDAHTELAEIEAYYTSDAKYLRRDLQTLLNNWPGELDRARSGTGTAQAEDGGAPPEWRTAYDGTANAIWEAKATGDDIGHRISVCRDKYGRVTHNGLDAVDAGVNLATNNERAKGAA